jgi:predicted transcriptional regulator
MSELSHQAEVIANRYSARIPAEDKPNHIRDAKILTLDKQGVTQTLIAQQLGISQATVSRVLDRYVDTRELAKLRLHNSAASLVDRVINDADVEQSLEVLDRIDVVVKRQNEGKHTGGVMVVVNMPGQIEHQPPVIDLSLVPRNELPE